MLWYVTMYYFYKKMLLNACKSSHLEMHVGALWWTEGGNSVDSE